MVGQTADRAGHPGGGRLRHVKSPCHGAQTDIDARFERDGDVG